MVPGTAPSPHPPNGLFAQGAGRGGALEQQELQKSRKEDEAHVARIRAVRGSQKPHGLSDICGRSLCYHGIAHAAP